MSVCVDEIIDLMKYNSLEDTESSAGRMGSGGAMAAGGAGTRSRSNTLVSTGQRRGSKLNLHEVSYPTALSPVVGVLQDIADAKFEIENMRNNPVLPLAMKRRNSTGTIYVETTMSCQDNSSMIHVVCFVIRTHMLTAERENKPPVYAPEYDIFYDSYKTPSSSSADSKSTTSTRPFNSVPTNSRVSPAPSQRSEDSREDRTGKTSRVPSLHEIKEFFNSIYSKSQLESECIIMTLIYCERLITRTKGKLVIRRNNWKAM